MKNVFRIVMVFIGATVGAGFASGQEIVSFFVNNGAFSWIGIIICSIIIGFFSFLSLELSRKNIHITNKFTRWIIAVYIICGFVAMAAGSGALLNQLVGLPIIVGVLIFLVVCVVILSFKSKGVVALNTYITPIVIVGILVICVYSFFNLSQGNVSINFPNRWAIPSLVYASYNLLGIIPVFTNLKELSVSRKTNIIASAIASILLCALLLMMWYILRNNYNSAEIPILNAFGNATRMIYAPILLFAMLTTAVSRGYAILSITKIKIWQLVIIAIIVSFFSFSKIIEVGYSICGWLGFWVLYNLLTKYRG